MIRNTARNAPARGSDHFHSSCEMKKKSIVVMAIVPVTAMPYAAASALDERKPSTRPMQPTMSALLTSGM